MQFVVADGYVSPDEGNVAKDDLHISGEAEVTSK